LCVPESRPVKETSLSRLVWLAHIVSRGRLPCFREKLVRSEVGIAARRAFNWCTMRGNAVGAQSFGKARLAQAVKQMLCVLLVLERDYPFPFRPCSRGRPKSRL